MDYIERVKIQQTQLDRPQRAVPRWTFTATNGDKLDGLHHPVRHSVRRDLHGPLPRARPTSPSGRMQHAANWDAVEAYRQEAARKSDFERGELNKEKTGVRARRRRRASTPSTGKQIPIFISDYVLIDLWHRRHHGRARPRRPRLGVCQEVRLRDHRGGRRRRGRAPRPPLPPKDDTGILVNSDFLNGLTVKEAIPVITKWLDGAEDRPRPR